MISDCFTNFTNAQFMTWASEKCSKVREGYSEVREFCSEARKEFSESEVGKLCSKVRVWDSKQCSQSSVYKFITRSGFSFLTFRVGQFVNLGIVLPLLGNFTVSSIPKSINVLFKPILIISSVAAKSLNDVLSVYEIFEIPKEHLVPTSNPLLLLDPFDPSSGMLTNHISILFYLSCIEEILFRKLIQKTALPFIAQKTPKKVCDFLNHKWTRIAITSVLFSLYHTDAWEMKYRFINRVAMGIIFGLVAENYGTGYSALIHSIYNVDETSLECSRIGISCFNFEDDNNVACFLRNCARFEFV